MTDLPLPAEELQRRLSFSPFIAFLGMTVTEANAAAQRVTMTIPMRAEFERGAGSGQWHGGPLAAIIDTVGDFALVMALGCPLPTVNFRVDYLRPAVSPSLTATATVRRAARVWASWTSICTTRKAAWWRSAARRTLRCRPEHGPSR